MDVIDDDVIDDDVSNWFNISLNQLTGVYKMNDRVFSRLFGVDQLTIQYIHRRYLIHSPYSHPKYILWTFSFLHNYDYDGVGHLRFHGTTAQSFRDGVWSTIQYLNDHMIEVKF